MKVGKQIRTISKEVNRTIYPSVQHRIADMHLSLWGRLDKATDRKDPRLTEPKLSKIPVKRRTQLREYKKHQKQLYYEEIAPIHAQIQKDIKASVSDIAAREGWRGKDAQITFWNTFMTEKGPSIIQRLLNFPH